jgi:hypothetical protein
MKFIDKQLAFKLKKKGFDKPCFGYYRNDELIMNYTSIHLPFGGNVYDTMFSSNGLCENDISDAPTIEQVLKWLREEKNVHIGIMPYFTMSTKNNIMWLWEILLVGKIIECKNILYVDKDYNYTKLASADCCASCDDACVYAIKFVVNNLI